MIYTENSSQTRKTKIRLPISNYADFDPEIWVHRQSKIIRVHSSTKIQSNIFPLSLQKSIIHSDKIRYFFVEYAEKYYPREVKFDIAVKYHLKSQMNSTWLVVYSFSLLFCLSSPPWYYSCWCLSVMQGYNSNGEW